MKKFLLVMAVILTSSMCFSQTVNYGRLTFEYNNGYYFNSSTKTDKVLFVGRDITESLETINDLINICSTTNDELYTTYVDKKGINFIVIKRKRQYPGTKNTDKFVNILYLNLFGIPGICSWTIREDELYSAKNSLLNWGNKKNN